MRTRSTGGERPLLESADREARAAGRDLPRVGGLDPVPFRRRPIEDRVRDRDRLAAPLAEGDDERVQLVLFREQHVRLDALVLAVENEEGDLDAVAADVLDLGVQDQGVDRAVADVVALDVVDDPFGRERREGIPRLRR